MHDVIESAIGLRERRRVETTRAISAAARAATAERGFAGYTIEEICSEAGVSRRTFFNYFASKENAVLGVDLVTDMSDLEEAFVAGSGSLADDLVELFAARSDRREISPGDVDLMRATMQREPRLVTHLLDLLGEWERADIALVARRLGTAADDLRATTAVQMLGSLIRPTMEDVLAGSPDDFRTLLRRRVALARDLLG